MLSPVLTILKWISHVHNRNYRHLISIYLDFTCADIDVCLFSLELFSLSNYASVNYSYCPACRTTLVATRFRVAVICPIIQVPHCIRVFFYFVDLCLLITFFNFIMNYVPIVTFWIFTYHKIWILSIMFCFIWSYWIIYFLACLEVSWRVVS